MSEHNKLRFNRAHVIGWPGSIEVMVLGGIIAALVLWGNDLRQDRKHTVTTEAPTSLFAGTGHSCDTRQQIAVVERGVVFSVRRIRYWKDCATLDVRLSDGRSGHFVFGVGHIVVQPPLP